MTESNLERLKKFDKIADDLENTNMPESYWNKEYKILQERKEENKKKVSQSIAPLGNLLLENLIKKINALADRIEELEKQKRKGGFL